MTGRQRRVAITGLGLVTPVGNDVAATWDALLAGKSGVAPITHFDASGFPVRIAAEVKKFDPRHAIEDRSPRSPTAPTVWPSPRRGGSARCRIRPEGNDAAPGLAWWKRQGEPGVRRARGGAPPLPPDGHFHPDRLLTDGFAMDPLASAAAKPAGLALLSTGSGSRLRHPVPACLASGSQAAGN